MSRSTTSGSCVRIISTASAPLVVGKSHLIQALGHQACRQGYRVLFTRSSRLFTDLGGGHADGTWKNRLKRYLKPDLLLVDDFAMKELTLKQAEDFYY
ncbi:MAG: ATP-binding protein [Chloroflexi bacterium]|nr:ATP-binding protein [Chloroflexota bacterium]